MNGKEKQTLEGRQIEEAVASVFHTLLLHRSLGKFQYKAEGSYQIGTLGIEDVDCDFIDLTYVRLTSDELSSAVRQKITAFRENLRQQEEERNGQITLEFYEKKRRNWPLGEESIPWELWMLKIFVVRLNNESEHQRFRESVGETLSDIILSICRSVNRPQYVPKMPMQSELPLVFDTRFADVQPYLHSRQTVFGPASCNSARRYFTITYEVSGPAVGPARFGSTVQKLIKLSL